MGKAAGRSERCRVVIKARPTFTKEEEALDDEIKLSDIDKIACKRPEPFKVDRVYLPADGDSVYDDEVKGLVSSLFQGFNATVFAYGASGSGKTHTVLGTQEHQGIVDRVTEDIFERYDPQTCTLSVMVEELYCETFSDLLASTTVPAKRPLSTASPAKPSSTPRQQTHKYKATELEVDSKAQLSDALQRSLRKRRTAETRLNEFSSRSHVIVTLTLTQRIPMVQGSASGSSSPGASSSSSGHLSPRDGSGSDDGASDYGSEPAAVAPVTSYLIGKLFLVDLAGSENIKRSGAEGRQQKEAGLINRSLCHLKTVIEEVFSGGRVSTYRSSKLTYCLRDALGGGNSKLLVIACISTAVSNITETKETLRFAEMARKITNTPMINTQPKDELIKRLEWEIQMLQDQLQQAAKGNAVPAEVVQQLSSIEAAYAELQEEKEQLEKHAAADAAAARRREAQLHQQIATARASAADHQAAANSAEALLRQQLDKANADFAAFRSAVAALEERLKEQLALAQASASEQLAAAQARADALQQQLAEHQAATDSQAAELQMQLEAQQVEADSQIQILQQQLSALQAASSQQQAEAESHIAQLQQQLEAQQLSASQQRADQDQRIADLHQQLAAQQAAAAEQEAAASSQLDELQQQLSAGHAEVQELQSQLRQQLEEIHQVVTAEASTAAALQTAKHELADSRSQCILLQQQLAAQEAATDAARKACRDQEQHSHQLQQQLVQQAAEMRHLHRQLHEQEQTAAQLQQHLDSERQAKQEAVATIATAQRRVHEVAKQCKDLQQQLTDQERQRSTASSICSSCIDSAADLKQQLAGQKAHSESLRLCLQQQKEQQEAERAAAAQQAAAVAAQHQQEQQDWQQALAAAEARTAQLQQQAAAEVADLKQQHRQEMDRILQQTVQKANTEKLRCKEHLALQVHNLMADAQSLSQALAENLGVHVPDETPLATPTGSANNLRISRILSPAAASANSEQSLASTVGLVKERSYGQVGDEQSEVASDSGDAAEDPEQQQVSHFDDAASSSSINHGKNATRAAQMQSADMDAPQQSEAASSEDDAVSETACSSRSECESSCSLADTYLRQHHQQQLQTPLPQQGHYHTLGGKTSGAGLESFASPMHTVSPAIGYAAGAPNFAPAAEPAAAGGAAAGWPKQYKDRGQVDEAAAAAVFHELTGGQLLVKPLEAFLKDKEMGGQRHSMRLGEHGYTQPKRKHELIQDLMAWYTHEMATAVAAPAADGSSRDSPVPFHSSSPPAAETTGPHWEEFSASPAAGLAAAAPAAAAAVDDYVVGSMTPESGSRGSSSNGGAGVVDLCTPDTGKAAAAAAVRTAGGELSPSASTSSLWGWLTSPSGKKSKKGTAAAAAQSKQERRPTSAAGAADDGRQPGKHQQVQGGPLAIAATAGAGPAPIAEGVAADQHGNCDSNSATAAGSSMLEQFLLHHSSPDPTAPAGQRTRPAVDMDRLIAAQRSRSSKGSDRTLGGSGLFGLQRRAREVRISSRRR